MTNGMKYHVRLRTRRNIWPIAVAAKRRIKITLAAVLGV
jgi:hypothetical protein